MAIEFECPACRVLVRVADAAAGRAVRCGACDTVVTAAVKPPPEAAGPDAEGDPFDRPRPRRRRRPRPKGRSTAFWLLVIIGGITVFVGLSCGGLFLATGDPKWRTFDSPRGGYRVELPAAPRDDLPELAGPGAVAQDVSLEGTILLGRLEEYVVAFGSIPRPGQRPGTDEALMDAGLREVVGKEVRRVTRQTPMTVSGFPAREVEIEMSEGGMGVGRLVVAETKFYVVLACGKFADPDNERLRRFVNSFEVTDPGQLAMKKNREEGRGGGFGPVPPPADDPLAEVRRQRQRADERLREAREAAKLTAYREQVRRDREQFLAGRRAPAAPDPAALPGVALYLPFEAWGADGQPKADDPAGPTWRRGTGGVTAGAGARGKGAYLGKGAHAALVELRPPAGDAVTLSGWVKVRYAPVTVFRYADRFNRELVRVTADGRAVKVLVRERAGAGTYTTLAEASAPWTRTDDWRHVAVVLDGRAVTVYLDGSEAAAAEASGPVPAAALGLLGFGVAARFVPPRPAEDGFAFATRPDGTAEAPVEGNDPVGAFDEAAVFWRALSADEVRYLAGRETPASRKRRLAAPPPAEVAPPPRPVRR